MNYEEYQVMMGLFIGAVSAMAFVFGMNMEM